MSAALAASPDAAGFADPVFDAQAVFRACMDAVARPARTTPLPTDLRPPAPLTSELAAVALALCDHETAVWLDPALAAAPAVAAYLRFHTGARLTDDPGAADFALVSDGAPLPDFAAFAQGNAEYPDRSTTLVVARDDLTAGAPIRLAGPGIRGTAELRAAPLPADFADRLGDNHALFPRGVDLMLVAAGGIVGLPRSARVVEPA